MKPLGIHHMTAIDTTAMEFARLAAAAGCQAISIFTFGNPQRFPLVNRDNQHQFQQTLRTSGLHVVNIDAFMLLPTTAVEEFLPAMELGAELGARCVSTQIFDPEKQRVVDTLGRLCDYSEQHDMAVSVEFMAFSPLADTLQNCAELVNAAGKDNLGISIDILHLIRTGGIPADIATIDAKLIRTAQLCDSNSLSVSDDYAEEAMAGRLTPGQGQFPLRDFLRALPDEVALELEVPNTNVPAGERINAAVSATRKLLDSLND